jgi:putative hydrolase of the HAD superfamily
VIHKECAVKAVTFDLWETLLFEKDGDSNRRNAARYRHLMEALNILGLGVTINQVEAASKQVISRLLEVWSRNEDVSHVEQLELLVKFVSNNSVALKREWVEDLSSAYVSPFFDVPPYLNPDAESVLEELVEAGKRVGLICNTGLTPGFALRRFLGSEGVLEFFDFLVFSDEVGFRKPEQRVFDLAARKLGVDSCSAVHVGDNLRVDVYGAKNAGFRAIHFACENGRDKVAETDPNSLVALSRNIGNLSPEQVAPDRTINKLAETIKAIKELEKPNSKTAS